MSFHSGVNKGDLRGFQSVQGEIRGSGLHVVAQTRDVYLASGPTGFIPFLTTPQDSLLGQTTFKGFLNRNSQGR